MTAPEKFETWAIVEVMGFKRYAGHVTEQVIGGASLLRVDVPQVSDDHPAFCKLVGVSSIYAITPCDEATARKVARVLSHESPLPVYIPPEQLKLPAPSPTDTRSVENDRFDDDEFDHGDDALNLESSDGMVPCEAESPDVPGRSTYFCTLERGHEGDHATFDADDQEMARWPQ